jgi:ubiquinone/menaquinone biosynthesis C-methylase UbiE
MKKDSDFLKSISSKSPCRKQGVYYLTQHEVFENQEDAYIKLRTREGRVYSDEVVKSLPSVDRGHSLYQEWSIRRRSLKKLVDYLNKKEKPLRLLDVGCGNGWMSHHLARIPGCEVYGLDTNRVELEQGARVFKDPPCPVFLFGDLFEDIFKPECFDLVVLAGSVQYFPDLTSLLPRLFSLLRSQGEVHVLDSPFYNERTVGAAKERTRAYFENLGFPEMIPFYHHHVFSELVPFEPLLLYDPKCPLQRLLRKCVRRDLSPFPWIKVIKVSQS